MECLDRFTYNTYYPDAVKVCTKHPIGSMKRPPHVDRDRHAGGRVGTAEGDDLIGAIVLVGGALEQRAGRGAFDLRVREIGGGTGAFQEAGGDAIKQHA